MEVAATLADSHRSLSVDDLGRIIDREEDYVRAIVHLGQQLGLIESTDDGYQVVRDVRMQLRQSSEGQRRDLLSSLLQQYQPFISFASSLVQDNEPERAALQTDVVHQLGIAEEDIKEQFLKLGDFSSLLRQEDDEVKFEFDVSVLTDGFIEKLSISVQFSLAARLFLKNRLGDEIVAYLDSDTVDELTNALSLFWDRPRSAIAAAGRAVEDVQRDLGNQYGNGADYSAADGIGQLTDMLQSDSLIKKRHLHGGNYLAGMRNPSGGHGKDPEELERWDVSPEVALGYVLAAIHYTRSLYAYIVQDRLVL
ncbi:hypothetical protein EXE53_15005 [Halorubrum sp. SD626R]|uniref:hypothetical protein n=1 Tax=Halorubrum sp. SD626R TaxID=1419722 RepID=UPI0010F6F94F|nr:hypothetical protein [Halorubrum sp. SD626R]TKX79603.1 hypothetical protein EXE53_15005 [Halorubrum sp. SD626R]